METSQDEYAGDESLDMPSMMMFNEGKGYGISLSREPNGPGVPTNVDRFQQDYDGLSHLASQSNSNVTPKMQYSSNLAGISKFTKDYSTNSHWARNYASDNTSDGMRVGRGPKVVNSSVVSKKRDRSRSPSQDGFSSIRGGLSEIGRR